MLQFASTASPPRRFGHPPDSRKMISPRRGRCFGFQPARRASSGNHEMSPCLKTIWGFAAVTETGVKDKLVFTEAGFTCLSCLSTGVLPSLIEIPNRKKVRDKLHPSTVFKRIS